MTTGPELAKRIYEKPDNHTIKTCSLICRHTDVHVRMRAERNLSLKEVEVYRKVIRTLVSSLPYVNKKTIGVDFQDNGKARLKLPNRAGNDWSGFRFLL